MSTRPQVQKLAALSVSTLVAAVAGYVVIGMAREEAPTVKIVDTSEEIAEKMEARRVVGHGEDAGAGETFPPRLIREPLDEETARLFFPGIASKNMVYDPDSYMRRASNRTRVRHRFGEHPDGGYYVQTNDFGMRENEPVLTEQPDLRVLVTGDSHTDGVCSNSESFANVLEALLTQDRAGETVEVLNAGTGSHNLYNYLGTLERLAGLEPDLYIVTVYGGNDFSGAMYMHRYFQRRAPYKQSRHKWSPSKVKERSRSFGSQELIQEIYFLNHPEDVPVAIELACSISEEIRRQCAERGIELLFLYLPPPSRGQPNQFKDQLQEVADACGLDVSRLTASDRVADGWLDFLRERKVRAIDLREYFQREEDEPYYWRTDHHLNVAGHDRVARILRPQIAEIVGR